MDGHGTKWRRNISKNFHRLSKAHERYRRQTDGRAIAFSERGLTFTFANKGSYIVAAYLNIPSCTVLVGTRYWHKKSGCYWTQFMSVTHRRCVVSLTLEHQTTFQPHQSGQHGCTQTCTPIAAGHQQRRGPAADDLVSQEHQGPTHVTTLTRHCHTPLTGASGSYTRHATHTSLSHSSHRRSIRVLHTSRHSHVTVALLSEKHQ